MSGTNTNAQVGTPLTQRAGFLISQLGFYAAARFTERLAPLGLQPRQFGLLTHLAADDGQTQQQLADRLAVHRNMMVGIVDDLEHRGLVHRRRHPTDRRAHAVHLTDAARHLLEQAQQAADEHDTALLAALDQPDRHTFIALLQRLCASTDLIPGVHPTLRGRQQKDVARR
ncbi:MAG: MarR family winged helix-turn-helix transcriptional regulator [Dermatophilaceae bacterium]